MPTDATHTILAKVPVWAPNIQQIMTNYWHNHWFSHHSLSLSPSSPELSSFIGRGWLDHSDDIKNQLGLWPLGLWENSSSSIPASSHRMVNHCTGLDWWVVTDEMDQIISVLSVTALGCSYVSLIVRTPSLALALLVGFLSHQAQCSPHRPMKMDSHIRLWTNIDCVQYNIRESIIKT